MVRVGVRLLRGLLDCLEREAAREGVARSVMVRKVMEKGLAEFRKERAAALYMDGKTSISGAADVANLTIPEMVEYLVSKGYRSSYSLEGFRRGLTLLERVLTQER